MKIRTARFLTSAASARMFPPADMPEVVFVGRSNVGKSSLLNILTAKKGLAKTSATPGKTRLINFFVINERVRFVDVPGYGFAHASRDERRKWRTLVDTYFASGRPVKLVILLVDSRHALQDSDSRVIEWLSHMGLSVQVVLTKIDKLSRSERARQQRSLGEELRRTGYQGDIPVFSSVSGEGKLILWRRIVDSVALHIQDSPTDPVPTPSDHT